MTGKLSADNKQSNKTQMTTNFVSIVSGDYRPVGKPSCTDSAAGRSRKKDPEALCWIKAEDLSSPAETCHVNSTFYIYTKWLEERFNMASGNCV